MLNKWFDDNGNLKIESEDFYCEVKYEYSDCYEAEIKDEIMDFVRSNYRKYAAGSDIVAIYYSYYFAKETKDNYSECTLLCRSGVTNNPNWDKLEKRSK